MAYSPTLGADWLTQQLQDAVSGLPVSAGSPGGAPTWNGYALPGIGAQRAALGLHFDGTPIDAAPTSPLQVSPPSESGIAPDLIPTPAPSPVSQDASAVTGGATGQYSLYDPETAFQPAAAGGTYAAPVFSQGSQAGMFPSFSQPSGNSKAAPAANWWSMKWK